VPKPSRSRQLGRSAIPNGKNYRNRNESAVRRSMSRDRHTLQSAAEELCGANGTGYDFSKTSNQSKLTPQRYPKLICAGTLRTGAPIIFN
jgi:hypothetical protein